MENEWRDFLLEGMKAYKKAAMVMKTFYNTTQDRLKRILESREDWGDFVPVETKSIRSTKYWDDYPYINAQIHGTIDEEPATIEIGVNWYESETDYPFYCAYIYNPAGKYDERMVRYSREGRMSSYRRDSGHLSLKFDPDFDDFDLERDFDILLDEFVKVILQT